MVLGAPETNATEKYKNITVVDENRAIKFTATFMSVTISDLHQWFWSLIEAYWAELKIATHTTEAHLAFLGFATKKLRVFKRVLKLRIDLTSVQVSNKG